MKKFFILDTNVLIHNPHSLYSFADNIVVIPITVIEELDQLKGGADKKGMHARQVLRELDGLLKKGALKKGAKMSNKGILRIALIPKDVDLPGMDLSIADNKILTVAWSLQNKGNLVFFVSKDVNARIKAEALGLKSADYEKEKVEYGSLYKGWREIELPQEEITRLIDKGRCEISGYTFLENEFGFIASVENPGEGEMARFDAENNCLYRVPPAYSALGVKPLNPQQRIAFDLLMNDDIQLVTLMGQAGTGKTLMALACALSKVLQKSPEYEQILVARPIMPLGRDIGYLPGSKDKKLNYWMQPIFDNLEFILKQSVKEKSGEVVVSDLTAESLMKSDIIEIEALTYIRGRNIPNQFIIVDEAQNLTPHEIKTIISRAGTGTKIVLTGDPEQIDNPYLDANSNGLSYIVERLKKFELVGHVFLTHSERSELAALAVNEL
ncbi:MAG: PhoH family protein [Candidatus Omnitrophica bacterium]|nr:PhoH family protein [Candidatus Omnitrophota bacterium]